MEGMNNIWRNGILGQAVGILILVSLLGLAPTPHEVRRGFERARRAQSFASSQAVASELAQLAEALPWRDDLWSSAGLASLQANEPGQAIRYFERAAHLSPAGQIGLGEAYFQSGDIDAAIQTWDALNRSQGPSAQALTRLAAAYTQQDDYNQAISALKSLLELNPAAAYNRPTSELYYQLGLLLAAHDPGAAPAYLLQAAQLNGEIEPQARQLAFTIQRALPKEEPAHTLLAAGRTLALQNQWGLASHAFHRATRLRPDYAEAWAYLGEARQHTASAPPDAGLDEIRRALALDPNSMAANTFMALYWQRQGHYQQALEYLLASSQLEPQNPVLLIHQGDIWAQRGDLIVAQEHYRKAIEMAPYSPIYYRSLAEFCIRYNVELRATALPAARQALLLDPEEPTSLDVMGQVLFRLGDQYNAERFWLRALSKNQNHASAHLHLGLLYIFQDQIGRARGHLAMALSLAPGTPTAYQAQRLIEDFTTP
jgi:tetratricopeptide (TPR) repeat protein